MNDNNESCSIFDFVNAQFAQDSSKKKNYQDNPACYEFDSVNVIGKINAYSGTFFENPIKNSKSQTLTYTNHVLAWGSCGNGCDQWDKRMACGGDAKASEPWVPGVFTKCYDYGSTPPACKTPDDACPQDHKINLFSSFDSENVSVNQNKHWYGTTDCDWSLNDIYTQMCASDDFTDDGFPTFRCNAENNCQLSNSDTPKMYSMCPSSSYDRTYPCTVKGGNLTDNPTLATTYQVDNPSEGGMRMEIYHNLSSLVTLKKPDSVLLQDTVAWRTNLILNSAARVPDAILPPSFSNRMYIMSLTQTITNSFYHSIYTDYGTNPSWNLFNQVQIIGSLKVFFNNYLQNILRNSTNTQVTEKNLKCIKTFQSLEFISKICQLPIVSMEKNVFTIQFFFDNVTFQNIQNRKNDVERVNLIESYFQKLLEDGKTKNTSLQNVQSGFDVNIKAATYQNLVWDQDALRCTFFDFSKFSPDEKDINAYYVENQSYSSFLENPKDKFLVLLSTTIQIKTWSPILYMYAKINFNVPKDKDISKGIANTVAEDTYLMPSYTNFEADQCKGADANLFDCYYKYCAYIYKPSNYKVEDPPTAIQIFLYGTNSCSCMNTDVTPRRAIPAYGNKDAMCFSNQCSADMPKFGLTNELCRNGCADINSWLGSEDPGFQITEVEDFDKSKYNKLCRITNSGNFNWYYFCVVFTGLVIAGSYFLPLIPCKRVLLFYLLLVPLSGLLGTYIGFLMSGESRCGGTNNRTTVCQSKLSKSVKLPLSCCPTSLANCECITSEDCNNELMVCSNGICTPKSGVPNTKQTTFEVPTVDLIVLGVHFLLMLLFVIFFLCFYSGIAKMLISMLLVVFYGVVLVVCFAFYWKQKTISYKLDDGK